MIPYLFQRKTLGAFVNFVMPTAANIVSQHLSAGTAIAHLAEAFAKVTFGRGRECSRLGPVNFHSNM